MRGTEWWRALVRVLRRWPAPVPDAWSIEQHARFLVQKIARENAARHALAVARAELAAGSFLITSWDVERLERRLAEAERLRSYALVDLRLVLGLPEHPTQAEVGHWGEAP